MESARQAKSKRRMAILLSIAAIPLLLWYAWTQFFGDLNHRTISVTGTLQAKEIPVASKVGGRIAAVFAQEGDTVKAGQTLVEFDISELDARKENLLSNIARSQSLLKELKNGPRPAEIAKSRAAADQALKQWEMLKAGNRPEDIARVRSQVQEAQSNLDLLRHGYRKEDIDQSKAALDQTRTEADWIHTDYERYRALSAVGAVSSRQADELKSKWEAAEQVYAAARQAYSKMLSGPRPEEIEAAKERLNALKNQESVMVKGPRLEEIEMARAQYLQAKAALDLLLQGTRCEQIERAQAELAMTKAQLSELEATMRERKIASPADAEVSVMDLHAGEVFAANRTLATLTRLDDIWTRVYIPERQLARVRVGQEVEIKVDAYPERVFEGKVIQIPDVAEFTPRNVQTPEERSAQVFGIKVSVANKDHFLRGGMNAEVVLPPVESPWNRLARLVK